jgi:ribosome maturation factor RimP
MRKVPQNLLDMVEDVVAGLGYEPWGLELLPRQPAGQLMRVYIDADAGIDVEDCAKVSRQLSAVLDVEDPIHGEYTLEVSSPGLDRPLFTEQQLARYVGSDVRIKLLSTAVGRKNFRGRLLTVEAGQLNMQVDGEEVSLPLDQIDTARVVPQY